MHPHPPSLQHTTGCSKAGWCWDMQWYGLTIDNRVASGTVNDIIQYLHSIVFSVYTSIRYLRVQYAFIPPRVFIKMFNLLHDFDLAQMHPVVPLLVEFYPKFWLSLRFKFLQIRGSFTVKYVYPSLYHPSEFTEMPKTSKICRKSHIHLRIKLYE